MLASTDGERAWRGGSPRKSHLQGALSAEARSKLRRPEGGVGGQVILRVPWVL